jgi:superfamily II DNA or RNA helicase
MSSPKKRTTKKSLSKILDEKALDVEEIIMESPKKTKMSPSILKAEKELPPIERIVLKENQGPHIERMKKILFKHNVGFDMSSMGAGKTYTSTQLALDLGFKHIITICPVSTEAKWGSMRKYGAKIDYIMSYQALRSVKNKQPKHGLLERIDSYDEESNTSFTFFNPTAKLIDMLKEGTLVILDEAQHIKNKNDQFLATQAIAKAVNESKSSSRMLLLSGTPIDKEEQAVNIMQMMRIIRSTKLFNYNKKDSRLTLYGAKEVVNYCMYIDEDKTEAFVRSHPWRPENIVHNCYLLFQNIIKPAISSAMPSPPLDIDCKNGYYVINPEADRKELMKAIAELHSSLRYDERREMVTYTESSFGSITRSLKKIELAKIRSMARVARDVLESDPNSKVGLFATYVESLDILQDLLGDYNPLRLDGSVNKNKRQEVIDKFQEGNLKHRVIIANLQVASTGIDLDDKFGTFPRYAFAIPKYNILEMHQLTRRFLRLDSKSNPIFRFFYGKSSRKETSILSALSRKTTVLKDTLEGQVSEGIKFPGDYEDEVELDE